MLRSRDFINPDNYLAFLATESSLVCFEALDEDSVEWANVDWALETGSISETHVYLGEDWYFQTCSNDLEKVDRPRSRI